MRRREFIAGLGGSALPFSAFTQQSSAPVIGLLGAATPSNGQPFVAALFRGLSELGFVEGRHSLSNTGGQKVSTSDYLALQQIWSRSGLRQFSPWETRLQRWLEKPLPKQFRLSFASGLIPSSSAWLRA